MASNNISVLMVISLFMMLLLLPSAAPVKSDDLVAATEEMQRANYFTFVTLINMSPPDTRLDANVTFLMPKDRMLATMAVMPEGSVSDFLLQHSIPSPLLLETLEKFPTGTTIPSSLPNFILRITNNGRKNFVLNNVKIISPNICVAGSSIRCHGIDGILSEADVSVRNSSSIILPPPPPPPPPSCPNNNNGTEASSCMASSPSPSSPSSPYSPFSENLSPPTFTVPIPIEADSGTQNSGSFDGSLGYFVTTLMLIFVGIYF